MPRTTKNALRKFTAKTRRKRTGVITKAKYKPRTTAANRSLIKSNAFAIRAIKRLMPSPLYTDWQYSNVLRPVIEDAALVNSIHQAQLMSPSDGNGNAFWEPVMRQDQNVVEASSTRVLRMQLNLRYRLGVANWAQFSTFVVSIRKDAADRIINQQSLVKNQDFITNLGDDFNVRLNPAVFKVHYARYVSLMYNAWVEKPAFIGGNQLAANPVTTFAKGQVNMKLNFNIKQPTQGVSWTVMNQSQLPPSQRLFLLTFISQQADIQGAPSIDVARVNFDALFTCYNAN